MYGLLHGAVFLIRLKHYHYTYFPIEWNRDCLLGTDSYVRCMQYVICKMFMSADLKVSTFFVCFVFILFRTPVSCFACTIEIWQSLNIDCTWLHDCFWPSFDQPLLLCQLKCVICCVLAAQIWLDLDFIQLHCSMLGEYTGNLLAQNHPDTL